MVAAVGHGCAPCKLRRVRACEARGHACIGACLAPHAARRRSRAVPRHPHVQTGFAGGRVPNPLSCLPPLPLAPAPGIGGPAALLHEQPARRRTRQWPQAGAFEARRLHVGRLRRRQREVRCECTRTARATTRRRTVERHARWHDERRGKVQRIGGHHGRVSSQIGCATPITANALTGPK